MEEWNLSVMARCEMGSVGVAGKRMGASAREERWGGGIEIGVLLARANGG